ncbi:MAG: hypothetical protein JWL77_92 [Chthonomonadaceae bacterium]|nr:hypothetical protein [Chthonomonadaceae bacterium]
MNIRNGRLRTFAVLGTLTTLAFSTVQAGQVGGSENQLVGISLRTSTFRDVLRKYGQPDEVQGGGPFLPNPPKTAAVATGGPSMGGRGGMPGSGGMSGAPGMPGSGGGMRGGGGGNGKRATSRNGFPGQSDGNAGGAPGGGGPGSGGGYPGAGGPGSGGGYPGAPGGRGAGGYPGAGGPGSGGGYPGAGGPGSGGGYPGGYPGAPGGGGKGGLPGFSGGDNGPGSGGGYPGAGIPGSGETAGSDQAGELPVTEATWWYHNPRKGYHLSFLFNKDGRVIQIQEYGVASLHSGKTRQGIALGSNMTQVLSRYGWSNDGAHDGENVIMRYGDSDKVAFQMVRNRVLGITVAVGH